MFRWFPASTAKRSTLPPATAAQQAATKILDDIEDERLTESQIVIIIHGFGHDEAYDVPTGTPPVDPPSPTRYFQPGDRLENCG